MTDFIKTNEFEGWTKEDLVRIKGEDGVFRFKHLVENGRGERWVDVYGPLVEKKQSDGRRIWTAAPSGAAWRSIPTDRIVDVRTKTSSRTDSGIIKERGEKKMATPQQCLCKCGSETKGGKFIPGHDARLKGQFIREYREATTQAAKDKVTKAVEAINPMWTKYLTDAKPAPVKKAAAKKASAPAKKAPSKTAAKRTTKKAAAKSA